MELEIEDFCWRAEQVKEYVAKLLECYWKKHFWTFSLVIDFEWLQKSIMMMMIFAALQIIAQRLGTAQVHRPMHFHWYVTQIMSERGTFHTH